MERKRSLTPSFASKILIHLTTLLVAYVYICLSVALMRVFGFPYEPLTESRVFMDGLIMAVPLFIPLIWFLAKIPHQKFAATNGRVIALKSFAAFIPFLVIYSFCFLYINIKFAPAGESYCSGEVIKKNRVIGKNGVNHRIWVQCKEPDDSQYLFEHRVSQSRYSSTDIGELWPMTYVVGRLGIDFKKITHR